MYFYRLMSKKEFKDKEVLNYSSYYEDCINTHKYVAGKKYVHLFLNAESCFEDFESDLSKDMVVGQFDIPDEVVFKYGIGLGSYNPVYNLYTMKYRTNLALYFWLPEIAIELSDFDYGWCTKISPIKDKKGKYYLPVDFITPEDEYRDIVNDGYLLGYNNEQELLKKYNQILLNKKDEIKKQKFIKRLSLFESKK